MADADHDYRAANGAYLSLYNTSTSAHPGADSTVVKGQAPVRRHCVQGHHAQRRRHHRRLGDRLRVLPRPLPYHGHRRAHGGLSPNFGCDQFVWPAGRHEHAGLQHRRRLCELRRAGGYGLRPEQRDVRDRRQERILRTHHRGRPQLRLRRQRKLLGQPGFAQPVRHRRRALQRGRHRGHRGEPKPDSGRWQADVRHRPALRRSDRWHHLLQRRHQPEGRRGAARAGVEHRLPAQRERRWHGVPQQRLRRQRAGEHGGRLGRPAVRRLPGPLHRQRRSERGLALQVVEQDAGGAARHRDQRERRDHRPS